MILENIQNSLSVELKEEMNIRVYHFDNYGITLRNEYRFWGYSLTCDKVYICIFLAIMIVMLSYPF